MAPNPPFADGDVPPTSKWNTGVYRYAVSTSAVDVVSSTTETTLFSATVTAGHMSTDRLLRCTVVGDMLKNASDAVLPTLRIKFGGTVIWADQFGAEPASQATRRPFVLEFWLANLGATNSQFLAGTFTLGDGSSIVTTGIGQLTSGASTFPASFATSGTSAIDTTANATLDVTWQWGTNSASLSMRKRYALLELV